MHNQPREGILEQFDMEAARYEAFALKIRGLIIEILNEQGKDVHSVSHRVKTRASFKSKIFREGKEYTGLADVTDLCGIRIIAYFPDDVDSIAGLIEKEFQVDGENSIDKRAILDPDRFGYLSLHLVVSLPLDRIKLTEYKRFSGLKAEVQVRSILQHAWAEIEHDLGYKTKLAIPREVRRRFSRLAGLLEIADQEFLSIRRDLLAYKQRVGRKIEQAPQSVSIDKLSLAVFISSSDAIAAMDIKLADLVGATVKESDYNIFDWYISCLHSLGIKTVAELSTAVDENRGAVEKFAASWLRGKSLPVAQKGISLLYLIYVLLATKFEEPRICELLADSSLRRSGSRMELAAKIKEIYVEILGRTS